MSETIEIKPASEEELREALMDVVDPELGIDVVNLGLIYGIHIDDANIATVDMTLTSAACPLTDVIEDQAKSATDGLVSELRINWVWMPPCRTHEYVAVTPVVYRSQWPMPSQPSRTPSGKNIRNGSARQSSTGNTGTAPCAAARALSGPSIVPRTRRASV